MTLNTSEIAALIVASGKGDRKAFQQLYSATAPKLLGVVIRLVKSRETAEDVLQDVYVRIWMRAESYSPDMGSAWGWMASIARNRAIDVLRMKTPATLPPEEDGTDWFDKLPGLTDESEEFLIRDSLRVCLETLDPQVRRLILGAYYEGWSREELAERENAPVNTIKTWLHRGLSALKACLESKS